MEIRKIEGIIPVEAINRDLPIKLENFSYQDMKKLLSTTVKGERKKSVTEELEGRLIKATFEGFTDEGKAKLKIGEKTITAEVRVDSNLKPGDLLTLSVRSTYPEIELKLVSIEREIKRILSELARNLLLNKELRNFNKLPELLMNIDPSKLKKPELQEIAKTVMKSITVKDITPETIKNYIKTFLSPLTAALISSVDKQEPEKAKQINVKDAATQLILHMILGSAFGFIEVPILIDDFESRTSILIRDKNEPLKIKLEVIYKDYGYIACDISLLHKEISVEFTVEKDKTKKLIEENLNGLLSRIEAFGLNVVFCSIRVDRTKKKFEESQPILIKDLKLIDINA